MTKRHQPVTNPKSAAAKYSAQTEKNYFHRVKKRKSFQRQKTKSTLDTVFALNSVKVIQVAQITLNNDVAFFKINVRNQTIQEPL